MKVHIVIGDSMADMCRLKRCTISCSLAVRMLSVTGSNVGMCTLPE